MDYQKESELIRLKEQAGLTNRELSFVLGVSPSALANKLNGFSIIKPDERQKLKAFCENVIQSKKEATA